MSQTALYPANGANEAAATDNTEKKGEDFRLLLSQEPGQQKDGVKPPSVTIIDKSTTEAGTDGANQTKQATPCHLLNPVTANGWFPWQQALAVENNTDNAISAETIPPSGPQSTKNTASLLPDAQTLENKVNLARTAENGLPIKASPLPDAPASENTANLARTAENGLTIKISPLPGAPASENTANLARTAENGLPIKASPLPGAPASENTANLARTAENGLPIKASPLPDAPASENTANLARTAENGLPIKTSLHPNAQTPGSGNDFPGASPGKNNFPLPSTKPGATGEPGSPFITDKPDLVNSVTNPPGGKGFWETANTRDNLPSAVFSPLVSKTAPLSKAAYNPSLSGASPIRGKNTSSTTQAPLDPVTGAVESIDPLPDGAPEMAKLNDKSLLTLISRGYRDDGEMSAIVKGESRGSSPSPGFTATDSPQPVQITMPAGKDTAAGNPGHSKFPVIAPQLLEAVEKLHQTVPGRIKMVLHPPELGTLDLYLRWKDKNLSLAIIADNDQARQALLSNGNLLRHSLQSHGISIDQLEIALRGEMSPNDSGPGLPWSTGREQDDYPVLAGAPPEESLPPARYEHSDDYHDNYRGMGVNILV